MKITKYDGKIGVKDIGPVKCVELSLQRILTETYIEGQYCTFPNRMQLLPAHPSKLYAILGILLSNLGQSYLKAVYAGQLNEFCFAQLYK